MATSRGRNKGKVDLQACPYSSLCRQAVIEEDGGTKVFDMGGTHASIKLIGRKNIDVAIVSSKHCVRF